MNDMSIRNWADFYLSIGMRPIPLYSPRERCQCTNKNCEFRDQCFGKVPKDSHWADKHIFHPEEFDDSMNIGLAMGRQHDGRWLVGIDIDEGRYVPNDFFPPTMNWNTGRGFHLVYEVIPDTFLGNWHCISNFRIDNFFPSDCITKIDIRYCRGILTAPPSQHKNGKMYSFVDSREPILLPPITHRKIVYQHKKIHPNAQIKRRWSDKLSHKNKSP
jgi:Bifunctional DNA primase/polymerase, N-terminal